MVADSAALCMLRDARDLAPFLLGHYLGAGFGLVMLIDDGSTDGTYEYLQEAARRTARISLHRVEHDSFRQLEVVSDAADALVDAGFHLIVPFDSDEFWQVTAAGMAERYAAMPEAMFHGRWLNFVQRRDMLEPRPYGVLAMKYRMPPLEDRKRKGVLGGTQPYLACATHKVGFKSPRRVDISHGQHALREPLPQDPQVYEIFHLPLRYRSEIIKRGETYELRRQPLRDIPQRAWQSAYHRDVVLAGRVDEEWAASSQQDGCLDFKGRRIPLIRDLRLLRTLVRAARYTRDELGLAVV
jgi:hypothetical protein